MLVGWQWGNLVEWQWGNLEGSEKKRSSRATGGAKVYDQPNDVTGSGWGAG